MISLYGSCCVPNVVIGFELICIENKKKGGKETKKRRSRMQKLILYRIGALAVRVWISGYAMYVAIDQQPETTLTDGWIDILVMVMYLEWHVLMQL